MEPIPYLPDTLPHRHLGVCFELVPISTIDGILRGRVESRSVRCARIRVTILVHSLMTFARSAIEPRNPAPGIFGRIPNTSMVGDIPRIPRGSIIDCSE